MSSILSIWAGMLYGTHGYPSWRIRTSIVALVPGQLVRKFSNFPLATSLLTNLNPKKAGSGGGVAVASPNSQVQRKRQRITGSLIQFRVSWSRLRGAVRHRIPASHTPRRLGLIPLGCCCKQLELATHPSSCSGSKPNVSLRGEAFHIDVGVHDPHFVRHCRRLVEHIREARS